MLISQLQELIKNEDPCTEGYSWFLKKSKGCKTAVEFFEKCKKEKNDHWFALSPHGYLIWIFSHCLDWGEFGVSNIYWYQGQEASKFLLKHFQVTNVREMSVKQLCEALIRAFE